MTSNQQPIEKVVTSSVLDVQEIFLTVQGEGPNAGRSAVFVRLAGCNLQCPMCDTDYTSGRKFYGEMELATEIFKIRSSGLVVITGGEPFRQDMSGLIRSLYDLGDYEIQVETNGTVWRNIPPSVQIVISPKTGKIAKGFLDHSEQVVAMKYVLRAGDVIESDGLPETALGHDARPMLARPFVSHHQVYVQPADEKDPVLNQLNLDACVLIVHKFGYTLSIQTHKMIGLP